MICIIEIKFTANLKCTFLRNFFISFPLESGRGNAGRQRAMKALDLEIAREIATSEVRSSALSIFSQQYYHYTIIIIIYLSKMAMTGIVCLSF